MVKRSCCWIDGRLWYYFFLNLNSLKNHSSADNWISIVVLCVIFICASDILWLNQKLFDRYNEIQIFDAKLRGYFGSNFSMHFVWFNINSENIEMMKIKIFSVGFILILLQISVSCDECVPDAKKCECGECRCRKKK